MWRQQKKSEFLKKKHFIWFSPTRPSWSSSRNVCPSVCLFVCLIYLPNVFFRPLIGPKITWSIPGISLVRIRETPNLSTDAHRYKKKEIYTVFFFFRGFGLEGGLLCTLQQSTGLHFIHQTTLNFFPVQCTSHIYIYIYINRFNAKEFNSLDCIELWCIANCWLAVHCNALHCSLYYALHWTVLGKVFKSIF